MFNLKRIKQATVSPYEKYLRNENVGPKADDAQPIAEKTLPHRTGDTEITTEGQMASLRNKESEAMIIEKAINDANSSLFPHRNAKDGVTVSPINEAVQKMIANRIKDEFKTEKESHWSQTYNEKKQQGELPKWPKNVGQHDKIVLNNDPRRFEGEKVIPLVGDITTADIDRVSHGIKTGASIDYDTAIVAILREAEQEKRELTLVEKKTVVDLKIARTKQLLKS